MRLRKALARLLTRERVCRAATDEAGLDEADSMTVEMTPTQVSSWDVDD